MFKIVKREEMAQGTVIMNEIEAPKIAAKAKPGQFVIVKANETGERIPLTISDRNPGKGTITIIYMVVGKSTGLFKTFQAGDAFQDVIGPLGKATHIEKLGNVVCVGGGTGVAVLYPITKGFKEAGNKVIGIIGARNKELLILEDKMRAATDEFQVYGRRLLRPQGICHGCLKRGAGSWQDRPGGGHRPRAHDEIRVPPHQKIQCQDPGQPEPHHDRRHRHVRRLPGGGGRKDTVRVRGRTGIRRAPGGL